MAQKVSPDRSKPQPDPLPDQTGLPGEHRRPENGSGEDEEQQENLRDTQDLPGGRRLETLAAWLSGFLVAAVTVILIWEQTQIEDPPAFVLEQREIREAAGAHYLTVRLHNRGDKPAQQVEVQAELTRDRQKVDEAQVTIDWAPGRSHRDGTLVFREDPRKGQLELHVTGYAEP